MAASRLAFALALLLIPGAAISWPASAEEEPGFLSDEASARQRLNIRADRQFTDSRTKVSIAEGNVRIQIGAAELRADRIEFDAGYRTLFARGAVQLRRGGQYFQASALRYNLVQNEGELDDVYGVIDLEQLPTTFQVTTSAASSLSSGGTQTEEPAPPTLACPPLLPPVPDWHPQPWAVTAWGGQMIDAPFGDTFLFNGRMRPEAVLGVGLQRRIVRAGPLALELEADLFSHIAKQQPGGEFNQSKPYADLPAQTFGEGILGIGARAWAQPWLSSSSPRGSTATPSPASPRAASTRSGSRTRPRLGERPRATHHHCTCPSRLFSRLPFPNVRCTGDRSDGVHRRGRRPSVCIDGPNPWVRHVVCGYASSLAGCAA